MSDEKRLREEICEAGRRLYARNMVASNDGNITARLKDGDILATPTGVSKGSISPDMICKLNAQGEQLEGYLRPSSEIRLHLHCYQRRPDVHAVAHAHPPKATGFALAGLALDELTLPETIVSFGCIPLAPYATPGGEKLPQSIDHLIESCDAILLANHGAVTVGGSPMDAYYKMETLEHTAHITWVAKNAGRRQGADEPGRAGAAGAARAAGAGVARSAVRCEPAHSRGASGGVHRGNGRVERGAVDRFDCESGGGGVGGAGCVVLIGAAMNRFPK